jgi:60 kDa SS-A/Ro ribonucleoprotein
MTLNRPVWYPDRDNKSYALALVLHQCKGGTIDKDLFVLACPLAENKVQGSIFKWIISGVLPEVHPSDFRNLDDIAGYFHIRAFEQSKKATSPQELLMLIQEFSLPREAVPSEFSDNKAILEALSRAEHKE